MKKTEEIIGLPVVNILTGNEIGKVHHLLINGSARTVEALVIDEGKWYLGAKLLPYKDIAGLGEYAVTIDNKDHVIAAAEANDMENILIANIQIKGSKVLTRSGSIIGKVTEFTVNEKGDIISCEMEDLTGNKTEIPNRQIITYGKEVTIIGEKGEEVFPPVAVKVEQVSISNDEPAEEAKESSSCEPIPVEGAEVLESVQSIEHEEQLIAAEKEIGTQKFNEKHRRYLLGKQASRRIETDNGMIIVEQGGEITEEVLQKAKLAGKYVELSMNIQ